MYILRKQTLKDIDTLVCHLPEAARASSIEELGEFAKKQGYSPRYDQDLLFKVYFVDSIGDCYLFDTV